MFQYYAFLWAKHEVRVFPVAVYLRGGLRAYAREGGTSGAWRLRHAGATCGGEGYNGE